MNPGIKLAFSPMDAGKDSYLFDSYIALPDGRSAASGQGARERQRRQYGPVWTS
jgi:hypothetical protein